MMTELWPLVAVSVPTMIFLGLRHGLDIDHITAIDNLVRLYRSTTRARWVGAGFSGGHTISLFAEMVFIILVIGSLAPAKEIAFFGTLVGAIALGTIGLVNIYYIKKCGRTGSGILAQKVSARTRIFGPFGSSFLTGGVFGLGFDTATQISAITMSAIASATAGVELALVLAGFFALSMISVDTLDSVILRSIFSRMFAKRPFHYVSYFLGIMAIVVASYETYHIVSG